MEMQKLGFGFMRLPLLDKDDQGAIDHETLNKLVDTFIDKGFTYFDTAWMYHLSKSEDAVKKTLVDRYDRNSFQLATKLPAFLIQSAEDQEEIFNTQLEKCGVDYFDNYLVHNLGADTYRLATEFKSFDFVMQKKKEGKIKKIGFSFHDRAELLDQILTEHPEVEFVQLQLNYIDWEDPGIQSRLCYETARKHNKPVIVMEPLKGGNLSNLPPEAEELMKACNPDMSISSWGIRFAAGLEGVFMVLSGMSTMEQLQDNTSYMKGFKPLNDEELEILKKVREIYFNNPTIPCTACRYCVDKCPEGIPIPDYFVLYNNSKRAVLDVSTPQFVYYMNLASKNAKASDCIECRACTEICPQHIDIPEYLKEITEEYENKFPPPPAED